MIVISFVLVIVALILLIVGLVASTLGLVYASIAVSLVSAAFLAYGVVSRRGEDREAAGIGLGTLPGAAPEPALVGAPQSTQGPAADPGSAARTATLGAVSPAGAPDDRAVAAPEDDGEWEETPLVLVVPGRPRYHLDGCRYITGKDVEELELDEARAAGYTSCATCRPDEAIEAYFAEQEAERGGAVGVTDDATASAAPAASAVPAGEPYADSVAVDEQALPASGRSAKAAKSAKTAKSAKSVQPEKPAKSVQSAESATAARSPQSAKAAKASKASARSTAQPAAPPAKAAGTRTPVPPVAPAVAAPSAAPSGGVVIIPDRDKYHRPGCRFVRDAVDAERVTKATARRRGMQPCGVCKP